MKNLENKIASILENPLELAQNSSGLTIGLVGCDIPVEIFEAKNIVYCNLPWDRKSSTQIVDSWIEKKIAEWAKGILADWFEGRFDCFDAVVFSRASDDSQRLYYYICELQRTGELKGPKPMIFDICNIHRETSQLKTQAAIQYLCDEFDVSNDDLSIGIERTNLKRRRLQEIEAARFANGVFYEELSRANLYQSVLDKFEFEAKAAAIPIILVGNAPQDSALHEIIEAAGGSIVSEYHEHTLTRLGPQILDYRVPLQAIAQHYRTYGVSARNFNSSDDKIIEKYNSKNAKGVIFWLTEEEEALVWKLPQQIEKLNEMKIPNLVLSRQNWRDPSVDNSKIQDFLKGVAA